MMKGQLSIESVLVVFLAIVAASAVFVFMRNIVVSSQAGAEKALVYPEEPPQILSLRCYLDYGYATVQSDKLQGTINYQVSYTNGSVVKTSTLSANITDAGKLYFGALMGRGSIYSVRLYTPKWAILDTCTARVNDDVVLYMSFNEGSGTTASDSSYYENDGTISGATWTTGKVGNALSFDGVNGIVTSVGSGGLVTKTITVSAWVKMNLSTGPFDAVVIPTSDDFYLQAQWPKWRFYVYNTSNSYAQILSINDITLNKWYNLIGVYNGSYVTLYVDGVLQGSQPLGGNIRNSGNDVLVSSSGRPFNGTIDEVKIYDRALSRDEISAIWEAYQ